MHHIKTMKYLCKLNSAAGDSFLDPEREDLFDRKILEFLMNPDK